MSLSRQLLEQIDAFGYGKQSEKEDKEDCTDCCENCAKKKKELKENQNPIARELADFNKRLSGLKMFEKSRRVK